MREPRNHLFVFFLKLKHLKMFLFLIKTNKMFSNFLLNLNKTCITEGVVVQPFYSIGFGAVTLIYSRVAACDSCVAEEITSTQLMDRDVGQLQQHLAPGPPLLSAPFLAPQG